MHRRRRQYPSNTQQNPIPWRVRCLFLPPSFSPSSGRGSETISGSTLDGIVRLAAVQRMKLKGCIRKCRYRLWDLGNGVARVGPG